jgi:hypothetical protein
MRKIYSLRNKKGSLADSIFIPMYILIISITIFCAVYVWGAFNVNFTAVIQTTDNQTQSTLNGAMTDIQDSMAAFDYMFPFLVGMLLITSLIFAFKTGANIVYAFVSLIMWILALIMATIFTNIFGQFQITFPTVAASYPIIVLIMNNMKWIALFWAFLISLVMFTRTNPEEKRIEMAMGAYQ